MKVLLRLPVQINDANVPTVRTFYLKLMEHLDRNGIEYDISFISSAVNHDVRFKNPICKKVVKRCGGYKVIKKKNKYETSDSYDFLLSYHTHGRASSVIHTKIAYMPDTFYFDRGGFSGWAEIAASPLQFQEIPLAEACPIFEVLSARYIDGKVSKYHQKDEHAPVCDRPYIFLPTQVVDDEVQNLARVSVAGLLEAAIDQVPKNGYDLVIKRHPKCCSTEVDRLLEKARRIDGVHVTNASVHSLLPNASGVCVINSGVGFEALLYSKPVFTFGKSDYETVTYSCESSSEIKNIADIIEYHRGDAVDRIKQYVAYFLRHYLIALDDQRSYDRAFRRCGLIS